MLLPKPQGRIRDKAFLAWVHTQDCCAPGAEQCLGRIEANHAGRRPVGRKADCFPLCQSCHCCWTAHCGPFRGWSKAKRREWADSQVAQTREAWARHQTRG